MDADLGLLLIRLALGPMLVVHGVNKVAGVGGLKGTERWFDAVGLRPAWLHARVAAATEIAAGLLLTIGLLTGPTATACVGLMYVAARTDHRGKGYFVFNGGVEYVALIALVALALASTGPGSWSLDAALNIDTSGAWWLLGACIGGVVLAAGLLTTSNHRTQTGASRWTLHSPMNMLTSRRRYERSSRRRLHTSSSPSSTSARSTPVASTRRWQI